MSYITKDFLLKNEASKKIYSAICGEKIFDYHCHLNEKEILENKAFSNIFEVTLKYDHYKWRLMRNAGVDEEFITGNKPEKEKFIKYCEVIEGAFGNPLYHWTQMELENYFNCNLEINSKNAEQIWESCNKYIKENNIKPIDIILKSNVRYICTTNKMFDDLEVFTKINTQNLGFNVYPTFRPDDFLNLKNDNFINLVKKAECCSLDELEAFLEDRLAKFKKYGCPVADVAVVNVYNYFDKGVASKVFAKRLNGESVSELELQQYQGYLTYFFLKLFGRYDIVTELHACATRNNNSLMFEKLGADSGFDAIGSEIDLEGLKNLFDRLTKENCLGKVIVFNLNQNDNKQILALLGSFNTSKAKGQLQFGPAWWFLDNYDGIMKQLTDLATFVHFGSFVGMLTDSRSFLSYARHDYFRRILANFLGEKFENKEITQDLDIVIKIAKNICFKNATEYFGL